VNAGIGTDFIINKKTFFSLHLAITNIGNVAYQNHLSRLKYTAENMNTGRQGVFNTGRNFSIKMNVPLQFRGK
jgi:iron complex outermembrane receptor protein